MKKSNYIKLIALVLCIGILCIGIISQQKPKPKAKVKEPVKISQKVEPQITIKNPVDFDAYQATNPDVYAYMYMKDSVNTPILQHPTNDAYYLTYKIDGTAAYPGAVYSERLNSKDFTDPNTILYGHNDIIEHTMFNGITLFEDPTFFDAHRYLYIYTPTSIYQYEVFAAYTNDNRHIFYEVNDWNDAQQYENYLTSVLARGDGNIRKDSSVTKENQIVTLSTCTVVGDNRFIVQAVLKQKIDCPQKSTIPVEDETKKLVDALE